MDSQPPSIPNRFHFIFGLRPQTEPFHLVHYLCLRSCLTVNQPERVTLYYHFEPFGPLWRRIAPHLELVKVPLEERVLRYPYTDKLVGYFNYAHQSDFLRLRVLLRDGGVYADMDTLFINPLPRDLFTKEFVMGLEDPVVDPGTGVLERSLCNALLMSAPGSRFATTWLDEMWNAFDGSWSRHSCTLAGQLSFRYPSWISVQPKNAFFKHSWTRAGIHTLFEGFDGDVGDVLSFHLWEHLWWERGRTDFTTFHNGLIDEQYVRTASTTYATFARRFLTDTEL